MPKRPLMPFVVPFILTGLLLPSPLPPSSISIVWPFHKKTFAIDTTFISNLQEISHRDLHDLPRSQSQYVTEPAFLSRHFDPGVFTILLVTAY